MRLPPWLPLVQFVAIWLGREIHIKCRFYVKIKYLSAVAIEQYIDLKCTGTEELHPLVDMISRTRRLEESRP